MPDVRFVKVGRFNSNSTGTMERQACRAIEDFFKGLLLDRSIVIRYVRAERGIDGEKLIKCREAPHNRGDHYPDSVPVKIHLQGTQGLCAYLAIEGQDVGSTKKLLSDGPYLRKSEGCVSEGDMEFFQKPPASMEKVSPEPLSTPPTETLTEGTMSLKEVTRYSRSWFDDHELVQIFLQEMQKEFGREQVVERKVLIQFIKRTTGFEVPLDLANFMRRLTSLGYVCPVESGHRPAHYKIEQTKICSLLDVQVSEVPAQQQAKEPSVVPRALLNQRTRTYWSNPSILRRGLLWLCEDYPTGKRASAVGITKSVASVNGNTFCDELVHVIPELLLNMGFITEDSLLD